MMANPPPPGRNNEIKFPDPSLYSVLCCIYFMLLWIIMHNDILRLLSTILGSVNSQPSGPVEGHLRMSLLFPCSLLIDSTVS